MEYKVTGTREALEKPKFGQGGTHESEWIKRGTEGYITTAEQLHLKTYFTRLEAQKEGCRLFLPPGNTIGMSQQDWKRLLEELK